MSEPLYNVEESKRLLVAASHALRSYQFGNSSTDLAEEIADSIDRFLKTGEPQTLADSIERFLKTGEPQTIEGKKAAKK